MIDWSRLAFICRMHKEKLHQRFFSRSSFSKNDDSIAKTFDSINDRYLHGFNALVDYFWDAHKHYVLPGGTIAYYPGYPSIYGARNDGVEGVTRLLPLWSAYTASALADEFVAFEMQQHLSRAITNGTNPEHHGYWGAIDDKSTLICEGADVALALWVCKDSIWKSLPASIRRQVIQWLKQIVGKETADNNWHLFVILVDLVIDELDQEHSFQSIDRYNRIKTFYLGEGCFKDGPEGDIDLYNAWGFHYTLFWINQIKPDFDAKFTESALAEYCSWYQFSFTTQGVLLYGRSLPYRTAAPCPLLAAAAVEQGGISKGIALNATFSCWKYFVKAGALKLGKLTQGVFEENVLWTDPYSGPASSFWGVRSLVLFYYLSKDEFWKDVALEQLPAQSADVDLSVSVAGFRLSTNSLTSVVTLLVEGNDQKFSDMNFRTSSLRMKLKQCLYASACREPNNLLKMKLREFNSSLNVYRNSYESDLPGLD